MGNKNSTQGNNVDPNEQQIIIQPAVTEDQQDYYQTAQDIDDRIGRNADIYIERKIEIFIDPKTGKAMPYESRKPLIDSTTTKQDTMVTSENPRYVEFIVCDGNLDELREKYAVHKSNPDHNCKGNCDCSMDLFTVASDRDSQKISNKNTKQTLNQTSSEIPPQKQYSPTSTDPIKKTLRGGNCAVRKDYSGMRGGNCAVRNDHGMTGGNCAVRNDYGMTGGNCAAMKNNYSGMRGGNCAARKDYSGMNGGAVSDTSDDSPQEITASDESTISSDNMTTTTTSPVVDNKKKLKNNNVKAKKATNGMDEDIEDQELDEEAGEMENEEEEDYEEDVDPEDEGEIVEDGDEDEIIDDDDLEEIDEEEITEDGFIYDNSDITSSDLYKMQSRIFASETESDVNKNTKKNTKQNNKIEYDDDDNLTEEVGRAMEKSRNQRRIFDSEEKEILEMNSSSNEYMKRPTNKNNKYY